MWFIKIKKTDSRKKKLHAEGILTSRGHRGMKSLNRAIMIRIIITIILCSIILLCFFIKKIKTVTFPSNSDCHKITSTSIYVFFTFFLVFLHPWNTKEIFQLAWLTFLVYILTSAYIPIIKSNTYLLLFPPLKKRKDGHQIA